MIRAKAIDYEIWDLINLSKEENFEKKSNLIKSDLDVIISDIFIEKHARYKIHQSEYKRELHE